MTTAANVLQRYPLPVSISRLQDSVSGIEQQIETYQNIVRQFEMQHRCALEDFEHEIKQGRVTEHPSWEEALEWGVAIDEIERLHTIQKALQWILNLLP